MHFFNFVLSLNVLESLGLIQYESLHTKSRIFDNFKIHENRLNKIGQINLLMISSIILLG